MSIYVDRSLRLPESEYFADPQVKTGIALHHTVCHGARTTLDMWRHDLRPAFEKRFIGIEITSDGGLTEHDGPAYVGYQDLSARYLAELRRPRITLGRSIGLIAALGAGFVLGGAVHE